jgi:hypothetical protein
MRPAHRPRGACRFGSAPRSLRLSGQDHFDRRGGCARSTEHSVLAVDLAASISVSEEARDAVELGEAVHESFGSVVLRR